MFVYVLQQEQRMRAEMARLARLKEERQRQTDQYSSLLQSMMTGGANVAAALSSARVSALGGSSSSQGGAGLPQSAGSSRSSTPAMDSLKNMLQSNSKPSASKK